MPKVGKILLWVGGAVLLCAVVIVVAGNFSSRGSGDTSSLLAVRQEKNIAADTAGSVAPGVSYGKAMLPQSADEASVEVEYESDASVSSQPTKTDRMIIKTGTLSLVVENVRAGIAQISAYAEKNGGFVVNSNVDKEGVELFGQITVRIPAKIFDQGVADVKAMGQVESEQINGQDVTEEYVDLDSQLKNLRAAETQFLAIMRQAVKIEDILAVQNELTNVRGRIESIQGRMKYLQQSADLSTLTVYLSTDPNVLPAVDSQDQWKPWGEVKAAARSLLEIGKGLANLVIWLLVYIPLWIVIGLVVWGVVRLIRRGKTQV